MSNNEERVIGFTAYLGQAELSWHLYCRLESILTSKEVKKCLTLLMSEKIALLVSFTTYRMIHTTLQTMVSDYSNFILGTGASWPADPCTLGGNIRY
jgi:hypothetical protein